jgi:hypothetical protein
MNLEEFKKYVEATRKTSTLEAIALLTKNESEKK